MSVEPLNCRTGAQPPSCRTTAAAERDLGQTSSVSSREYSTISETAVLIRYGYNEGQQLDRIYKHSALRLMPIFLAIMILNHVDRTNLAYASITMNADLHIGPATYGLGSALFFIPFCIFQIPSNLVVARVGVRRWLAFLLLGWGTVATCMSLIHNVASFFALRLLLGVFESGAVPAMWYHLSAFFPSERITKPFALLTIGILAAQAVSGPVAAGFLSMQGLGGLHGWQWLFILEGVPTVAMSAVVWCCLPDAPACATWLSDTDRKLLEADLGASASKPLVHQDQPSLPSTAEQGCRSQQQHLLDHGFFTLFKSAICNPYLLYLCVLGVMLASASNTYVFFLPMIINLLLQGGGKPSPPAGGGHGGSTKLLPVILTCIPYTLAAVSCYIIAHSSQKRGELYYHTALPAVIGGIFFVLFPFLSKLSIAAGFAALVLVAVSAACSIGPKTAIVHKVTMGPSQVVAMPFYNSIIVLGGFIGPYITGIVVQRTGSFAGISVLFGGLLIVAGGCIVLLKYMLIWLEVRRGRVPTSGRSSSDDGVSMPTAPAAAVATANTATGHVRHMPGGFVGSLGAQGAGSLPKDAAAADGFVGSLGAQGAGSLPKDAAAADGTGVVVVQSEREGSARPRAAVGGGGSKV